MKENKNRSGFLETQGHDDVLALLFFVAAGTVGYLVANYFGLLHL